MKKPVTEKFKLLKSLLLTLLSSYIIFPNILQIGSFKQGPAAVLLTGKEE